MRAGTSLTIQMATGCSITVAFMNQYDRTLFRMLLTWVPGRRMDAVGDMGTSNVDFFASEHDLGLPMPFGDHSGVMRFQPTTPLTPS